MNEIQKYLENRKTNERAHLDEIKTLKNNADNKFNNIMNNVEKNDHRLMKFLLRVKNNNQHWGHAKLDYIRNIANDYNADFIEQIESYIKLKVAHDCLINELPDYNIYLEIQSVDLVQPHDFLDDITFSFLDQYKCNVEFSCTLLELKNNFLCEFDYELVDQELAHPRFRISCKIRCK